jgi:hypothetical protein
MPLNILLQDLSVISGFFPVVAALVFYRRLNKPLKLVTWYFIISVIFDCFSWIASSQFREKNTMPIFHFYIMFSVIVMGLLYYNIYVKSYFKILGFTLSASTLAIVLFYAKNILEYPSVSVTSLSVLLIVLSLIYFFELLNPLEFVHIEKQGLFWINAGVLFYSAVNIFLFMLLNQIPKKDIADYYMIHSVTNIIANILYSIGLLCKPQKTS